MTHLPQESSLTIGGVTYRLSKFTIPLYQEFVEWAKTQLPDPWAGLAERCKGLSSELAKHLIDRAEERAAGRGTMNDPEIQALAHSLPGVKKIMSLLFRKYQPSMSEADVSAVIEQAIDEHGVDFFSPSSSESKADSVPIPSA